MKLVTHILVLTVVCLISSCGAESEAKKAVLDSLIDPDSAKFSEFANIEDKYACFTVNAKNKMGGYTGKQQAYLSKEDDGKWVTLRIVDESHDECVKHMKRRLQNASK